MKVLFCSYHNPNFITLTEYIESAIKETGNDLTIFDDRGFIFPGRIRDRFTFVQQFDLVCLNKRLLKVAYECRPDIFIAAGGHRVLSNTISALKKIGIKTILWTIDAPINFKPIIDTAPYYDYIFCGGTEAIELLEKGGIKNTKWLPFACDPSVHKRVELTEEEKTIYGNDIAFVGSYYPNRAEILEELTEFNIAVWGPGWQNINPDSPLKKCIKGYSTGFSEWIKIFSASKIILVIHYEDIKGEIPCYQISPKVFESMSCAAFTITNAQRDIFPVFKPKEHLVTFTDIPELKDLIHYYLNNMEERKRIGKRGLEEVIKKHKYTDRIRYMLDIVYKN